MGQRKTGRRIPTLAVPRFTPLHLNSVSFHLVN
jgi:hypothetical protein